MTHKQILAKAIEKAIAGGFSWPHLGNSDELLVTDKGELIPMLNLPTLHWIIFNRDFAKALWPGIEQDRNYPLESWKIKLQQMVIADDPIKYLGEHLE